MLRGLRLTVHRGPAAVFAAAALVVFAACAAPPPVSVATPVGIVRADDLATARWIAVALQSAALRLEKLSPPLPAPALEAWVVGDPGDGVRGVVGTAQRSLWSGRWTLRVSADRGHAMIGHELFHARFRDRLRGWPEVLVEGLADRFGLPDDILGDNARTGHLLVLARRPLPTLTLKYESKDGTYSGLRCVLSSAGTTGPPPLELDSMGALDSEDIGALTYPERLYLYGVGYAAALRWLGDGDVIALPTQAPDWAELVPASPDEFARWAAAQLEPARLHRWALACFAGELTRLLRGSPAKLGSVDEALATVQFSLTVDDAPEMPLNDDPHFRELLETLWPWIADTDPHEGDC